MNEAEVEAYIKDHYGLCISDTCVCRKTIWLGTVCHFWKSCGCKTFDELVEWQAKMRINKIEVSADRPIPSRGLDD